MQWALTGTVAFAICAVTALIVLLCVRKRLNSKQYAKALLILINVLSFSIIAALCITVLS